MYLNRIKISKGKAHGNNYKNFADTFWWSYDSEVQRRMMENIKRAASGERVICSEKARVKDGFIDTQVILRPVFDKEGKVEYIIAEAQDITKIKEAENRWKLLYESMPGGSFIVNDRYVIEEVNDFLCEITGFTRKELIGQYCGIICPKGIKRKDGRLIPIIKSARRISFGDREFILENFQDITKMKEMEKALQETEQKYRELIDTFVDGVVSVDSEMKIIL
ncbi:MAG: PAS domain-containing protein [Candidatus Syntropharchaeia archaeon]